MKAFVFLSILTGVFAGNTGKNADITIEFTQSVVSIKESAGSVQLTLVLSEVIDCCTISVVVTCENNTAIGGIDYGSDLSTHIPVIFSADVEAVTFNIPIIDDNILEDDETFRVAINPDSLPLSITLGCISETTVTIVDNDYSIVCFDQSSYIVNENDGSVQPMLVLSNPASTNLTVIVNDIKNNASGRCDYGSGPYNVTFLAGQVNVKFDVFITDDDIFEGNETFDLIIALSSLPSCVTIDESCCIAAFLIMDGDKPTNITVDGSPYEVPEDGETVEAMIKLSNPLPCNVTVCVEISDITAKRDSDYGFMQTQTHLVTIPAGTTCASLNISICDDEIVEDDETFHIRIKDNVMPFGIKTTSSSGSAKVIIKDNDICVVTRQDDVVMFSKEVDFPLVVTAIYYIGKPETVTLKPGYKQVTLDASRIRYLQRITITPDCHLETRDFKISSSRIYLTTPIC